MRRRRPPSPAARASMTSCWPCVKVPATMRPLINAGAVKAMTLVSGAGGCRPPANTGPIVFISTVPTANTKISNHVLMHHLRPVSLAGVVRAAPAERLLQRPRLEPLPGGWVSKRE